MWVMEERDDVDVRQVCKETRMRFSVLHFVFRLKTFCPLSQKLEELVDRNRDGKLSPPEMRALALLVRKGERKRSESSSSRSSSYDSVLMDRKVSNFFLVFPLFFLPHRIHGTLSSYL